MRGRDGSGFGWRRDFLLERQLMQHVRERFSVHQPVFDGDVQYLFRRACRDAATAGIEHFQCLVDLRTRALRIVAHHFE